MTSPSSKNHNSPFNSLGLVPELSCRVEQLGYYQPTSIQKQSIPALLNKRDLLAQAETGSGKTAAFGLPLLQLVMGVSKQGGNHIKGLILVPTRELAQQVTDSLQSYGSNLTPKPSIRAVFGGVSINPQMLSLRGGCDILVATPGRLLDLVDKNAVKLASLQHLILDEADRMLSLGFSDELAQILSLLPPKRQTSLFSATFADDILSLAKRLLSDPIKVMLDSNMAPLVTQRVITVNRERKAALLIQLIKEHQWQQVLVFASAKKSCDRLAQKLTKAGIEVLVFHSNRSQGARERALANFKMGRVTVLIATDIAARGIDIEQLPVVINFDLPRSPTDYQHRVGRTGRAGCSGVAISLISHDEYHHFKVIEKKNKFSLKREQIVGFEADHESEIIKDPYQRVVIPPAGMGKKKRKK